MALGLSNGNGGDFLPICKWDARAGRFFRVDRAQGADGWKSTDVDLTMDKPKFAIDFGSIETGWLAFMATGPDFKVAPLGQPMPERPSKEHKAGFKVKLAGNALNGVREFSASSKAVLASIDALHSTFEASPEAQAGKIPVVELSGSTSVVTNGPNGKVTSYSPVFTIVSWTDRLPALGERTVPAPAARAAAAPVAAAPAQHVPPPHVAAAATAAAAEVPDAMPF
jgi:hypothetical protein